VAKYSFIEALERHQQAFSGLNDEDFLAVIESLGADIVRSLKQGGRLIVFGNGGSAAEASHFATELISRCSKDHDPWPAISLSDSSSNLTAIGNDYGFEKVFSRQVEGLATDKDCVIGLSTSGTSPNVIEALKISSEIGCRTYLLTGQNTIEDARWTTIRVPSTKTTTIQEVHLWLIHVLSEFCENEM
jgi:D-sedoheptulose 7-phosphate isomerase